MTDTCSGCRHNWPKGWDTIWPYSIINGRNDTRGRCGVYRLYDEVCLARDKYETFKELEEKHAKSNAG